MGIDVKLTSDGDLPRQAAFTTGADLVVQNVVIRTKTFLGEDPEDTRRGLPWERWNQSKATPLIFAEVEDLVGAEILATPGVVRIENITASQTNSLGGITVNADIVVEDGALDEAEASLVFTPSDPVSIAYRILR